MVTNTEKLFEELMEYTSFNNIDEIQDKKDLKEYFKQLSEQAKTGKQKSQFQRAGSNTRQALLSGWKNLKKSGQRVENRQRQEVMDSRKGFKTYQDAHRYNALIVNTEGKKVFRTYITIKGKRQTRWRDEKGRFIKKGTLESKEG